MRSLVLTMALGLGALGLTLATPASVRADPGKGTASVTRYTDNGYTPVQWRRGRLFYPGYGYYGGYYPYYGGYGGFYGGYRSFYRPRYYGGWGGWGYGYRPYYYGGFYSPGWFW